MQYNVEELSPVERKVKVDATAEEANAALATAVAMYRMKADIKGFRKGKAPSDMVESRFKREIYSEATNDLINYHLNSILGELKLTPLSRVDVDAAELVRDEPFSYTFSFEVAPRLELPKYKGLTIEQEEVAVDESQVEAVLNKIRDNLASAVPVTDPRHPVDGDVVTLTFQAFDGGKPLEGIQAENFEMTLGQGHALDEFEDAIKAMLPGQTSEAPINFPADFVNPALAGKTVTMKISLHAVKERKLPDLDDELAKKTGHDTAQALREAVTKSYLANREQLSKAAAQKHTLDELVKQTDIPLPPSLVDSHMDRMVNELQGKLERQGKSLEALGKPIDELREGFRPEAEYLVRSHLLLLAVAAEESLNVSNREIDFYLQQVAAKTGQTFDAVKRFHEDNNLIFALKDRIMADKAMEVIYDAAEVKKVPAAPVDEAKDGEPAAE